MPSRPFVLAWYRSSRSRARSPSMARATAACICSGVTCDHVQGHSAGRSAKLALTLFLERDLDPVLT